MGVDLELLDVEKQMFLECYSRSGIKGKACRDSGVSIAKVNRWLKNPDFFELYKNAEEMANDYVREVMFEVGVEGYEEELVYQGRKTGDTRKVRDHTILLAEAKRRDPKYARVELNVNEIPIKLIHGISISEMFAPQLKQVDGEIIDGEELKSMTNGQKALPQPEEFQEGANE